MPSAKSWQEVPVTLVLCLAAIFIHLVREQDLQQLKHWMFPPAFVAHPAYLLQRPWTPWSPALLHVDATHLILNVFWVWMLGGYIEKMWGHHWMFALCATAALGGNLGEAAAGSIGVGLSGVVYGLYGWWAFQSRRDPRLRHLQEPQLDLLFLLWIPVGFVLTWLELFPLGNWAHLGGLVSGLFLASIAPLQALQAVPHPVTEPADDSQIATPDQASERRPTEDP